MYALFCIFSFHRANWHYPSTLTEGFPCFFLSCKANAKPRKDGARSALFLVSELCCYMYCFFWSIVLFCVLFLSIALFYYSFFVHVYCTTATGCHPNCS